MYSALGELMYHSEDEGWITATRPSNGPNGTENFISRENMASLTHLPLRFRLPSKVCSTFDVSMRDIRLAENLENWFRYGQHEV